MRTLHCPYCGRRECGCTPKKMKRYFCTVCGGKGKIFGGPISGAKITSVDKCPYCDGEGLTSTVLYNRQSMVF